MLCQATQGHGMRLPRGTAWGLARAQRRLKARSVELWMGWAWGCLRGAARGRAGVRHAAVLERSMRLRWGAAWGSAGAPLWGSKSHSVKLRKRARMVPH